MRLQYSYGPDFPRYGILNHQLKRIVLEGQMLPSCYADLWIITKAALPKFRKVSLKQPGSLNSQSTHKTWLSSPESYLYKAWILTCLHANLSQAVKMCLAIYFQRLSLLDEGLSTLKFISQVSLGSHRWKMYVAHCFEFSASNARKIYVLWNDYESIMMNIVQSTL